MFLLFVHFDVVNIERHQDMNGGWMTGCVQCAHDGQIASAGEM